MLTQSVEITIIGMTLVFSFLLLLILCMHLTAYIIKQLNKYFPEAAPEAAHGPSAKLDKIALAIAVARQKAQ